MIQTRINRTDPKTGKPVQSSPQLDDSVLQASRMLEDLGREIPVQLDATWQFEEGPVGLEVTLRLTHGDMRGIKNAFDASSFEDKWALRMDLGHILLEFASEISKTNFERFLRSKQEWESTAAVEG